MWKYLTQDYLILTISKIFSLFSIFNLEALKVCRCTALEIKNEDDRFLFNQMRHQVFNANNRFGRTFLCSPSPCFLQWHFYCSNLINPVYTNEEPQFRCEGGAKESSPTDFSKKFFVRKILGKVNNWTLCILVKQLSIFLARNDFFALVHWKRKVLQRIIDYNWLFGTFDDFVLFFHIGVQHTRVLISKKWI